MQDPEAFYAGPAEMSHASPRFAGDAIATASHRGTRRDAILPGARSVTIERVIYWFALDEPRQTVRILAVFFGGQDHARHMLVRLLGEEGRVTERGESGCTTMGSTQLE